MEWSGGLYSKDQHWIEPDIDSLSDNMISVKNNHPNNLKCFDTGFKFNYKKVSKIIEERLHEIKNS